MNAGYIPEAGKNRKGVLHIPHSAWKGCKFMAKFITQFPLSHFEELIPLLLRCFPDFWETRLARGMHSFPYDLKLFCATQDGKRIGSVGIHDYQFLLDGIVTPCGGLCDVGIDPDYRGHGYAGKLQEFALAYCRKNYQYCPMIPLYTDKPGVYISRGWRLYEPERTREIRTEDFPKRNAFHFNAENIKSDFLRMKRPPRNKEEEMFRSIQIIYMQGVEFTGKCLRSPKTWLELFADPEHEWILEDQTYFLYRKDRLLEAYSADQSHPVNRFLPVQGGHDSNKIMLNLQAAGTGCMKRISELTEQNTLYFPIADTF